MTGLLSLVLTDSAKRKEDTKKEYAAPFENIKHEIGQ